MEKGIVDTGGKAVPIPSELLAWLDPLLIGLYLFVGLWIAAALFRYYKRRAYNLTEMETARAEEKTPDFLKTGQHTEAARLQPTGNTFSGARAHPPSVEIETETQSRSAPAEGLLGKVPRVGAILFALGNLIAVSVSALLRVERTHELFYALSTLDRWKVMIQEYWIGFVIALIIISLQFARFLQVVRARAAPRADGR